MTERLTPGQLRDLAAVVDYDHPYFSSPNITCKPHGELAKAIRDEAARREAEGVRSPRREVVLVDGKPSIVEMVDAPPPPAPDDLLKRLRSPMRHYAATADLCNEAADAIEALRARAEAAEARVKQLEAFMSKEVVPQLRAALAQGGDDRLRDDNATARAADQMPGLTKLLGGGK